MMVVFLMAVAFAVDIARWYAAGEQLQRTVDAAALAGVPYLPAFKAKADAAARDNLKLNGLTEAQASAAQVNPDTSKPSRLVVTATSTIPNIFATVLGFDSQTLSRTATADFAADANMGSPCNLLGNEPPASTIPLTVASSACPATPNFWNNIAGPASPKRNGDRYATRTCSSGDSNCSGSQNIDYYGGATSAGAEVPGQSYYIYKITASRAVTMQVQLFDPMFVEVGDYCERNLPNVSGGLWDRGDSPNSYVSDARTRYAFGFAAGTGTGQVQNPAPQWSGRFCTGDVLFGGNASDITTSFALINPTPTFNPLESSVICKTTYGGYSGNLRNALFNPAPGSTEDTVARNFRRWVNMPCTVTVPTSNVGKDYYLMVRTNVPSSASNARMLNPAEDPATAGSGHNRYGMRVRVTGGGTSIDVAISALERMPIYANLKTGTTNFYLARVTSGNAGSLMTVEFFDTGDASDVASIAIKDPDGGAPSGCKPTGDVVPGSRPLSDLNTSNCTLNNVRNTNGYNGKIQRVQVPIPDDYTCDDEDPADCWYKIDFTYGAGVTANDTTTWSVSLDGDPVRLVK
jgi:Flp pilus assembly protein TadG